MSPLYRDFEAFLAREQVTRNAFCRVTGFPLTTLNTMRLARSPRQETVDRLLAALETWKSADPADRAEGIVPRRASPQPLCDREDKWADAAAASNRAFLRALQGRRFDSAPARDAFDLDAPRAATSREPCFRCGVPGFRGCAHQTAMTEEQ